MTDEDGNASKTSEIMLSKILIRTWHKWLRRPVPTVNFRSGRIDAPSYRFEHDLDHMVSYFQGLVGSAIAGKNLNYHELASKELEEVDELLSKLEFCEIDDLAKSDFRDYLSDIGLILKELTKLG